MGEDKYICFYCVGENYLKLEIERQGEVINCSYCNNKKQYGYSLSDFAERIDNAFAQHYVLSPDSPPDDWSSYLYRNSGWEPRGMPIVEAIQEAADVSELIATDVQELLAHKHYDHEAAKDDQQNPFEEDSFYDEKDIDDVEWQDLWAGFEFTLKNNSRFFNNKNESILQAIFEGIETLNTRDRKPVVRSIGLDSNLNHLYRARVFQSEAKLEEALKYSDKQIGPPPPEFAKAGRMNAKGISVFYGATSVHTALTEVRPPVGSKVVVAKFDILQKLRVLDLSALNLSVADGSIFDDTYAEILSKTAFLRSLSLRMTKVVMPDDEYFEYLVTQVIADYLGSYLKLDGIIFPSAQSKEGLNITLFNHASKVASVEYPAGSEVDIKLSEWDGDEEVTAYKMINWLPATEENSLSADEFLPPIPEERRKKQIDIRKDCLSIDLNSILVEHIESVQIKSESFSVERIALEKFDEEQERDFMNF